MFAKNGRQPLADIKNVRINATRKPSSKNVPTKKSDAKFEIFDEEKERSSQYQTKISSFFADSKKKSSVIAESEEEKNTRLVLQSIGASDYSENDENVFLESSVYVSALSAPQEEEFFPAHEVLTEKQRHLSLIICPPDFVKDIYEHERFQETKFRPRANYIRKQPHLSSHMRMVLVDWMVDVSVEYHLEEETLQLAVNYVDRFLSMMVVDKEKLQLVGTTALLIAAKYEEIYPPDLEQFVFITDDSYTLSQVLKMERYLLTTLQFEMSPPTINFFLEYFLQVCHASQRCECLAKYLNELVLLDVHFLEFLPSIIAASIVCLANYTTQNVPWPVDLEEASQYTVADIYPCMTAILDAFKRAPQLHVQAVCDKFKENKYCQVALLEPPISLPPL